MLNLKSHLVRTAAMAALMGSLAVSPAFAQATDSSDTSAMKTQPAASDSVASDSSATAAPMAEHRMEKVETRIKTLHDKLMITADEEKDFDAVAQTMRDNEAKISDLIEQRHQNEANMTAVDDLQSYQQIVQAHADGMQSMIGAFKTLYGDMSDDQKKNADMVFSKFEGHDHKHGMKHHHKKQS
jgi:protein CpxP